MSHRSTASRIYHPDVLIFVVLIPFISAFNYYLTYSNIRFNWFLISRYAIDTAQGYLAWWTVRSFILYLDKKWPHQAQPFKRLVLQIIITSVLGLFIIASTTELLSWIIKGKPAIQSFYTFDLFIIGVWFLVMNGIYIALYYYNAWRGVEQKLAGQKSDRQEFLVRQGKEELKLELENLLGFYVDGEYVAVCNKNGRKYYSDHSLETLETMLPEHLFFRLNRQYIIHHQVVTGFRRADHGKIIALLATNPFFPNEITISRLKANAFKKWFRT